jgi:SAM-dependent methyltransferase
MGAGQSRSSLNNGPKRTGMGVLEREREYHDKLYSGFAQAHFAKPAVLALRRHMVKRILHLTGAGLQSRILSMGCGMGDTELLLAPHVRELVGFDLSPAGVQQARIDASRLGIANARFEQGTMATAQGRYDIVIAMGFLHHLQDPDLTQLPQKVKELLSPGGVFYSLEPFISPYTWPLIRRIVPRLLNEKYNAPTPSERSLEPDSTLLLFKQAGFDARIDVYELFSSILAELIPGWGAGFVAARALEDVLLWFRWPVQLARHFEVIARKSTGCGA